MSHKQAIHFVHLVLYLSSRVWSLVVSTEHARTMALLVHPTWFVGFFLSRQTSSTLTPHLPSK
jgi:hypothetical protein